MNLTPCFLSFSPSIDEISESNPLNKLFLTNTVVSNPNAHKTPAHSRPVGDPPIIKVFPGGVGRDSKSSQDIAY